MTAESPDKIELRFREREIDRLKARIAELEASIAKLEARMAQLLKNVTQVRESGDARAGLLQGVAGGDWARPSEPGIWVEANRFKVPPLSLMAIVCTPPI